MGEERRVDRECIGKRGHLAARGHRDIALANTGGWIDVHREICLQAVRTRNGHSRADLRDAASGERSLRGGIEVRCRPVTSSCTFVLPRRALLGATEKTAAGPAVTFMASASVTTILRGAAEGSGDGQRALSDGRSWRNGDGERKARRAVEGYGRGEIAVTGGGTRREVRERAGDADIKGSLGLRACFREDIHQRWSGGEDGKGRWDRSRSLPGWIR